MAWEGPEDRPGASKSARGVVARLRRAWGDGWRSARLWCGRHGRECGSGSGPGRRPALGPVKKGGRDGRLRGLPGRGPRHVPAETCCSERRVLFSSSQTGDYPSCGQLPPPWQPSAGIFPPVRVTRTATDRKSLPFPEPPGAKGRCPYPVDYRIPGPDYRFSSGKTAIAGNGLQRPMRRVECIKPREKRAFRRIQGVAS
jgi:hypothetical protein